MRTTVLADHNVCVELLVRASSRFRPFRCWWWAAL